MAKGKDKPGPRDPWIAWLVAAGAAGVQFFGESHAHLSGIHFLAFRDIYVTSDDEVSWIFFVRGLVLAISPLVAAVLTRRFGCRAVLMTVGIVGSLALLATAFTNTVLEGILIYGLVFNGVTGMLFPVCLGNLPRYFVSQRAKANSIAMTGLVAGRIIVSPLWMAASDTFAARGAFILFAGLMLQVTACGALFFPVTFVRGKLQDGELENRTDDMKLDENKSVDRNVIYSEIPCDDTSDMVVENNGIDHQGNTKQLIIKGSPTPAPTKATVTEKRTNNALCAVPTALTLEFSLFKNPYYVTSLTGIFFSFLLFAGQLYGLPIQMDDLGISVYESAYVISAFTISDLVGRIIFGILLDLERIKRLRIIPLFSASCLLVAGVSVALVPFLKTWTGFIGYAMAMGLFIGQFMNLMPLFLVEYVGTDKLPYALAYGRMSNGLSQAVLPLLIRDRADTGRPDFVFFFMVLSACGVLGALLNLLPALVHRLKSGGRKSLLFNNERRDGR